MNRIFIAIACLLAAGCSKFEVQEGSVTAATWQSALPDDMPVCRVSLPGAHDAATASISMPVVKGYATTQVLTIPQLWEHGVRVFDLRPAVVGDSLLICHSSIKTKTGFAEAVGSIARALDANQGEFAIILIRHEEEADDNSAQWGGKMADCINALPRGRVVRDFDPCMTVGQMRGRMLFLFREDIADTGIGARIYDWTSSADIDKQKAARIGSGTLWVQDYYDPEGEDDKLDAVTALMRDFAGCEEQGVWCINHTSAYLPAIFGAPNYGANAQNVNASAADYIRSISYGGSVDVGIGVGVGGRIWRGSVGIVMMDFAGASRYKSYEVGGDALLQAVIEHNPGVVL